jgi:transcription-repair coupling factor (superfamily II helicase)
VKVKELLTIYRADSLLNTLVAQIKAAADKRFFIKGLSGSLDAVIIASVFQNEQKHQLIIAPDREEANYLYHDMRALSDGSEVLLFPASFKRPYHFEEVDNSNVLERAETLSYLNSPGAKPAIVVSYPEALSEKVINQAALESNTFHIKVGEQLDMAFLSEVLVNYDFERSDFVYEPGQFSVRGGIIDFFSYSSDYPYRLEFLGNEIESIRSFHPETQLSVEKKQVVSLVPNVQNKLQKEARVSFTEFLPKNTFIWIQEYKLGVEVIDHAFGKAQKSFDEATGHGGVAIVKEPTFLYETGKTFQQSLKDFPLIEYGSKNTVKAAETFTWESAVQTIFNKDFKLLATRLSELQNKEFTRVICSDNAKQLERLNMIFDEINSDADFQPLYCSLRKGFEDNLLKVAVYTDHQIFERFHRYKTKERFAKSKSMTLKELRSMQPGDYVTHIDYGVARFAGLVQMEMNGRVQEGIRLVYKDDDLMTVSVHALHKISKYSGQEGMNPSLSKLGSGEWEAKKSRVKKKVRDIAKELIGLYAKRKAAPGFAFSPDSYLQVELESSFIYEDTPDQAKATADAKKDMEKRYPMDRLVCGDVGFGKTEIAIRAAFKAVTDSKQVAVLVPTTILAMQHYKTFRERLSKFPVKIDYINRFKSTKEINATLKKVAEGQVDILIGTHRITSKDIKFKQLGLMIIDEEQKFGVKVKDKLKELKANVDCLTLTATPIPRTLQFSLMGARDLSIISTPPPNRQPVTTELHMYDQAFIRDAVSYELRRGGQVFMVHNRIGDIEEMANVILKMVPDARVAIAHGQMEGDKLEQVMLKFMEGEYDVLVSTNIIESGLDIPNANTIIINRAHMFGLSDLHQMRGRVGRSNKKAFCYLLCPAIHLLTNEARKRLKTLEEFSDLGDGFKVAMRDLDIRGAGDLLGAEQSGFINDIGFEAYHKVLDEAMAELKETEFKDLFEGELNLAPLVRDVVIETDLEIIIPNNYVSNISERLSLYNQLDNIGSEPELQLFEAGIIDRFGPLPVPVQELIKTVRLRWLGEKLGMEKIAIRDNMLRAWFVPAEKTNFYNGEVFGRILQYVQNHARTCRLKDSKGKLILNIEQIKKVEQAIDALSVMVGE